MFRFSRTFVAFLPAMLVLAVSQVAWADPLPSYTILPLGFTDAEHTRDDGHQQSSASYLNGAGKVLGHSLRYSGTNTQLGLSAWYYNGTTTVKIGLFDAEHTGLNGSGQQIRTSQPVRLNETGYAYGYANRYDGTTNLGSSAWLYNGTTTVKMGLIDDEHTNFDGRRSSSPYHMNLAGQVVGNSNRYRDSFGFFASLGNSVWLYSSGTSTNIGLVDAEHTNGANEYRWSDVVWLNQVGQVAGNSQRFGGGGGQTAWIYDAGTATRAIVGLTDGDHVGGDGSRNSTVKFLNDAGQASGNSERKTAGGGQSAWFYNGTTTSRIGLFGAEHTSSDGNQFSEVAEYVYDNTFYQGRRGMTEAGQVLGKSTRYSGGDWRGEDVWMHSGGTTTVIGLTDSEHTGDNGMRMNKAFRMNGVGQVIGVSDRFAGDDWTGQSAWIYDGATTTRMGLTDGVHSTSSGFQHSDVRSISEGGHAIGLSERYTPSGEYRGQSVWMHYEGTTRQLGFTGGIYEAENGFSYTEFFEFFEEDITSGNPSFNSRLNDIGMTAGKSQRYGSGGGYTTWLYDWDTDQTISLVLSTQSTGFSNTGVTYMGNDGTVLGTYTLFSESNVNLGDRAFYFSMEHGLHDLGSLVDGVLDDNGWQFLQFATSANELGHIIGLGRAAFATTTNFAYILKPANTNPIPEPSTLALFALGLVSLAVAARRRSRKA